MMNLPIIAPSVLSADFADMRSAVEKINLSGAQWIHLDIMDGQFVPNLTFGAKMAKDIRGHTSLDLDVHLMTLNPENLVEPFIEAGANLITFHAEACVHAHRLAHKIRLAGARVGISIVPSTPVAALDEMLAEVDLVLIMTVNPGFGGQQLILACLEKVRRLKTIRAERNLPFMISIDGGVNAATLPAIAQVKPDILVMGSAFFDAPDKKAIVDLCRKEYMK